MWAVVATEPGTVGVTGKVYQTRPTHDLTTQTNELAQPTGFQVTDTPSTSGTYRGSLYIAGMGSDNAMVDAYYRFGRQGRPAPQEIPTLAAAAGPGRTGSCITAIAFYDSLAGEWGPLSGVSAAVVLANQKATTANIPTTCSDSRMDYVGVWVSMDGAAFRLSTKRLIGVSTITEGVATLSLGEAFPTTFEALPRGSMNAIYHERQFVASDALHPDVVYASASLHPERYEGLSFQTRNGEPITNLIATRDILLVQTPTSSYAIRGYTEDDMTMTLIDGDIGCFSPQACKLVNGNPVFPNDKGIFLFNGAFHNILKDRQTEWAEKYAANSDVYEAGFAVVDPNEYTYSFYTSHYSTTPTWIPDPEAATPKTVAWVGYYKEAVPELSGSYGQFEWFLDVWKRTADCAAFLSLPGSKRGDVYFGACDGILRKRDSAASGDDSDSYNKRLWIRTGAMDMGDPGGSKEDGKSFVDHWSYVESEAQAWSLYMKGGDEQAYQALTPDNVSYWWKDSVAASALSLSVSPYLYTYAPKSRHPHNPQKVSGHMLTCEYTVASPLGFAWRGFGGIYGPGPEFRPPVSRSGGS